MTPGLGLELGFGGLVPLGGNSGTSLDPATTAWVNAVVAAGGAVSAVQAARVNTVIVNLKTQNATNFFALSDRIWLHAAENVQQATIDLVNLGTLTSHGTITFAANKGVTGNGTNGYYDTGFISGNFGLNSSTLATCVSNSRTTSELWAAIGSSVAYDNEIVPLLTSDIFWAVTANGISSNANANAQGFWLASRVNSASISLYKNGSAAAFATSTQASMYASPTNIFILAANIGGAQRFSGDTISVSAICGGFTGTQSSQFQAILNAYLTEIGANVY